MTSADHTCIITPYHTRVTKESRVANTSDNGSIVRELPVPEVAFDGTRNVLT